VRAAVAVALALLALPCLAAAASPPLPVDFLAPAQADGEVRAAGQWAVLVFRDAPASFGVDIAPGATAHNHTLVQAQGSTPAGPMAPMGEGLDRGSMDLPERTQGALGAAAGWASLYIEADEIRLSAPASHAQLGVARGGEAADTYLAASVPSGAYRTAAHLVAQDGAWAAWQATRDAVPVAVEARGVRDLEWHNLTLACAGAGRCPGAPSRQVPLSAPGVQASVETLTFTDLQAPGGTLRGMGAVLLATVGGPSMDLSVLGTLRLPEVEVHGPCPHGACPAMEGRTLRAEGNLTLAALAPAGASRLSAGMGGSFASARLDEAAAPGFTVATGAALGVALLGLPLLVKVLVGLFARSARPPALQHPKRQALYDLIRAEPGLPYREIQRRLGWPNGTLNNHIARLMDVRLVVAKPYRNTVRYFENHGRHEADWKREALLRDPDLSRLLGWLREHPARTQADVLAHAQAAWGWTRSTTQDRLRELVEGGLLESAPVGRFRLYSALDDGAAASPLA
jgi:hypothetical protein